jgi:NitT/TauT family transport system substrate-binding protein
MRTALRNTLLVLPLLLLCWACTAEEPSRPAQPELRIGWYLWPGWYPMAIAQDRGLFAKHGVQVKPILYSSYTNIFSDYAAGVLDGGFGGLYELLKINVRGTKVVLVTDTSNGAEGLVALPSISKPQDLAGKRIGIQGGLTGSEFMVTTMLRRNGLSRADVTFIHVEPESVLEQMPEKIHAGYTWDPYLSRALAEGNHILFTTADIPGMIPDVLALQGRVVSDRPEEVRGLLRAWFEAVEFWKSNPEEAAASIARVTGLKPEDISLQGCRQYSLADNHAAFAPADRPTSLHFVGREQIDFIMSMGDAARTPDLDQVLDGSFLPPPR